MPDRRALRALLFFLASTCLLVTPARAAVLIGDPAPPLGLRDLDGKLVDLPAPGPAAVPATGPGGRVVILDFFATWCGPCHEALDALERLARDGRDAAGGLAGDVSLIIVAVGEPRETVAAFFARRPLPPGARVALDLDGAVARRFGQRRFPTTFLLDRAGVVRHINRGYGPGYEARLGRWLAGLRGGAAAPAPPLAPGPARGAAPPAAPAPAPAPAPGSPGARSR